MKRLFVLCLIVVIGLSACAQGSTPPPISNTPTLEPATQTPIAAAPATSTVLPPTAPAPLPTATLVPPTATETHIPPTATSASPALSLEQLRSAALTIQGADQKTHTFTLEDGKFQQGSDPAQPDYIYVTMGEKVAFGDLNGDGLDDAAITIAENYGGSGNFVSVVAVLNQAGQPNAVASALIDDRPMLNALDIKDGQILVDATIHGPADAMCCPGMPSKRAYRLIDNRLVLAQLSTTANNGFERVIQIDSPANGTEISSPFVIKGSVSISPFENTLGYAVFGSGATDPLEKSSFVIQGDGLGGPGTFELPMDPAKMNFKGPAWIQIFDVSAADGSYLASRTVFLVLK